MHIQEGPGWRLIVEPLKQTFPVLIGGENWGAEWRLEEASVLKDAVGRLRAQLEALADQLMAEESIALELELPLPEGSFWAELVGDRETWQLRFVLTPGSDVRGLEGSWNAEASVALATALEQCPSLE